MGTKTDLWPMKDSFRSDKKHSNQIKLMFIFLTEFFLTILQIIYFLLAYIGKQDRVLLKLVNQKSRFKFPTLSSFWGSMWITDPKQANYLQPCKHSSGVGMKTSPFLLLTNSKILESQNTSVGRSVQWTWFQDNLLFSTTQCMKFGTIAAWIKARVNKHERGCCEMSEHVI